MKQFEYKKVEFDSIVMHPIDEIEKLNELGEEGWELVFRTDKKNTDLIQDSLRITTITFYLKRTLEN